ncbi:MAG: acyl carrier protein [Paludibacteraceae bacterium]
MDKQEFIKNFGNQFDDTDTSVFTMETRFRDEEEWSSLVALAVLNIIAKKYEVKLNADEMKKTQTIQELYDLVLSKK